MLFFQQNNNKVVVVNNKLVLLFNRKDKDNSFFLTREFYSLNTLKIDDRHLEASAMIIINREDDDG